MFSVWAVPGPTFVTTQPNDTHWSCPRCGLVTYQPRAVTEVRHLCSKDLRDRPLVKT